MIKCVLHNSLRLTQAKSKMNETNKHLCLYLMSENDKKQTTVTVYTTDTTVCSKKKGLISFTAKEK